MTLSMALVCMVREHQVYVDDEVLVQNITSNFTTVFDNITLKVDNHTLLNEENSTTIIFENDTDSKYDEIITCRSNIGSSNSPFSQVLIFFILKNISMYLN